VLNAVIFVTGAAVLALELLASRIMAPYFGVSLYIWAGILSITLTSLALGYWAGGRLAARKLTGELSHDHLVRLFLAMPAVASAALVVACLVYPYLFPWLARYDLVRGAFVGATVLLLLPLTATSAMNPLLVAILLVRGLDEKGRPRPSVNRTGDAGAGRVFFISTLGSVAGVLLTAFGLIPHLANFDAVLVIAIALASLPLVTLTTLRLGRRGGGTPRVAAIAALAAAAALLWTADRYTGRTWVVSHTGARWQVEASLSSLFGTVKVLKSEPLDGSGRFMRIYYQDGVIQNIVDSNGVSLAFPTYALEALALAYRPDLRSALVLGLGAGIVPMRLARRNIETDVVEINPTSLTVAQRYFGFEPRLVTAHVQDARTYLRRCGKRYDVIIVDLFHGDGLPDYLLTREFFAALRNCLGTHGVTIFNKFTDVEDPAAYADPDFLVTLQAELPAMVLYRPRDSGNSFVVASRQPVVDVVPAFLGDVVATHAGTLGEMLHQPRALDAELLRNGVVVTDARNGAAHEVARRQLSYRQSIVRRLPGALMLN
jgi:Spermine/spermidine synthase domain